ncbi:hypothetical protein OPT61_g9556 [Boeremia exigua]|uniref:Uncharacterized protein n=1 Tax=Boeremia exigua TaxID=749465 RepID=A0ACC2HV49_9PLEO|nr:hypothetical protein OPT61_g9556 [Boeremia exigua]
MTTLSPSRDSSSPVCRPIVVHTEQHLPSGAALVPRSTIPEPGSQGANDSPHTIYLNAVQTLQEFNAHVLHDNPLSLSTASSVQDSARAVMSTSHSTHEACDSDVETTQASSESSVDIIIERSRTMDRDISSTSPRKPLPVQWMSPSTSHALAKAQSTRTHDALENSPSGSPSKNKSIRATRSSITVGKVETKGSFLTKEALDAVNANISSSRRSPSKVQRSPTKAPWNSPNVSPKASAVRQHTSSFLEPLSPPKSRFGHHVTANHSRAPSSITSTGATSFYTAHGSPVRSYACSQTSFSSAEDIYDDTYSNLPDDKTDVSIEQVDESSTQSKSKTIKQATSIQALGSQLESSVSIPPRSAVPDLQRTSPSTQSRIPRISVGKISSAHAPTLSSTLKQTKSTQTLRSPKAATGKSQSPVHRTKTDASKSSRHVRTVDSAGSTPILLNRKGRSLGTSASGDGAGASAPQDTSCVSPVHPFASNLQDTTNRGYDTVTPSRASSASTVKATQTRYSLSRGGDIPSSDADDEHDDSTMSIASSENDPRSNSPTQSAARYKSNTRRATISEMPVGSSLTSDLRATATEFIPAQNVNVPDQVPQVLPDMYALDGYGIPWFYHMYPVPCLFPPMHAKGRSKSSKKWRPKKQQSTPISVEQFQHSSARPESIECAAGMTASQTERSIKNAIASRLQDPDSVVESMSLEKTLSHTKSSDGPFASQLDEIDRQTTLQTGTGTLTLPHKDLTIIRNVVGHGDLPQHKFQGYRTEPSRRRNHRQADNGLYGGRGNVGVPLYATDPFPNPIAPMGRPAESYVGPTVGTSACGTIEIAKAAEYGAGPACNSCEPGH